MSKTEKNIQFRDARDRVIDQLGFGETYPLRDLPVRDERLTVPFDSVARVPVDNSQPGVSYQVFDKDGRPVTRTEDGRQVEVKADGTGTTVLLETPPIQVDVTYSILARKARTGREAYLHQSATIKVGLDTDLEAWILAPLLNGGVDEPSRSDPRIIDYGMTVEVTIADSQEGVDYRLVDVSATEEVVLSAPDVRGIGGDIILRSGPVYEDTDIRIRATKTFDPAEGRQTQTDLLVAVLPLKVRANRSLQISVAPSPVVDFRGQATVRIAPTQRTATYRLFAHRILDPEYVHTPAPDSAVVRLRVPGEPEVQVRRPPLPETWRDPPDYSPVGETRPGNGGDLLLELPSTEEDHLVIVQASKEHQAGAENTVPSSVQLQQPALVLVRPDPAPALRLGVVMANGKTDGVLRAFDGQLGVFYYFRKTANGKEFKWPAYFHKQDAHDPQLNKGVDQLAVDVDFVVAADRAGTKADTARIRSEMAPEAPRLETGRLPGGTTLHGRAVKAQTRIEMSLNETAQIPALPAIRPESPGVDRDKPARILVIASHEGDRYELTLEGEEVKRARNGNGDDLVFVTEPLAVDTTFEVRVTRPDDAGIPVERVVRVPVLVRPDAGLAVSVAAAQVDHNKATDVQVEGSQHGVIYQLQAAGNPLGKGVEGNSEQIALTTGPLTADIILTVRASRAVDPEVWVDLQQQVTVSVRPAAG